MDKRTSILGAVLLALFLAEGATAQDPRLGLELRTGFVGPTQDLGRTDVLQQTGYVTFGQPDASPLLGAGLLAQISRGWSVRLSLDHQFDSQVDGLWSCAPFVACPAVLIEPEGRVKRWILGGDVRFRAVAVPGPVQPVVFAGGGLRWTRLTWSSPIELVPIPQAFDESDLFGRLGVGLSGTVGPVELFGEADGTIGPFGAESVQSIEGLVPDGRETGFDIGVVLGARVAVR